MKAKIQVRFFVAPKRKRASNFLKGMREEP